MKAFFAVAALLILSASAFGQGSNFVAGFQRPLASFQTPPASQLVGAYDPDRCAYHLGEDYPQSVGSEVRAIANGVVVYSENVEGLGHAVIIEHTFINGTKITSSYFHMKRKGGGGGINLSRGPITRGTLIGYVTGVKTDYGTGPHLHLGIRRGAFAGTGIDPATNVWRYPGYTTLLDANKNVLCRPESPHHPAMLFLWQASSLLSFIDSQPPPPPEQPLPPFSPAYTIGFGAEPGPDGRLETADDVPQPSPCIACKPLSQMNFSPLGVHFTSGQLFQGGLFPSRPATNHYVSSSVPDATFSVPVYGVRLVSYSVWSVTLYAFSSSGSLLATHTVSNPDSSSPKLATLQVKTSSRIARFTVRPEGCSPSSAQCERIVNVDDLSVATEP